MQSNIERAPAATEVERLSPAATQEVAYPILMRWWRLGGVALVIVYALALMGILSGNGILGVPYILCGFIAAGGALGGMVLALWRGFIEGNQIRAPRNTSEGRR